MIAYNLSYLNCSISSRRFVVYIIYIYSNLLHICDIDYNEACLSSLELQVRLSQVICSNKLKELEVFFTTNYLT